MQSSSESMDLQRPLSFRSSPTASAAHIASPSVDSGQMKGSPAEQDPSSASYSHSLYPSTDEAKCISQLVWFPLKRLHHLWFGCDASWMSVRAAAAAHRCMTSGSYRETSPWGRIAFDFGTGDASPCSAARRR